MYKCSSCLQFFNNNELVLLEGSNESICLNCLNNSRIDSAVNITNCLDEDFEFNED